MAKPTLVTIKASAPDLDIASLIEHYRYCLTLTDSLLWVARDLARFRKIEEQLRSQLQFAEAIAASLGEGIYALDRRGRLIFMNPAAESALGWKQSELLGREIHGVIHYQRADRTSLEAADCPFRATHESGQTVIIESDVFTRRDGHIFQVTCTSSPIVIEGRVEGRVIAFHKIMAHHDAQPVASADSERYRLFFEYTPKSIYVLDRETLRFLDVNEAALQLYGYTREEFLSMHLKDIHASTGPAGFTGAIPDWCLGPHEPSPARHRTRDRGIVAVETVANMVPLGERAIFVVVVNEVVGTPANSGPSVNT
jgi:PAS domain S-box-containing protein